MKNRLLGTLFCLPVLSAFAAPVDLTTWTVQNWSTNAGIWNIQLGNTSVLQTVNGNPTVFLSDQSALGTDIQGKIKASRIPCCA